MAFHRHFVERQDFEVKVVTNCVKFPNHLVSYEPVFFGPSTFTRRLFHTRMMPWVYGIHSLTSWGRVSPALWNVSHEFKPDAVFTIAGSWDWSALVAQRIARRLKIPLVASFNDWFSYGGMLAHPIYHGLIRQRFHRFYQESDLALCTCEGMKAALGPHPNAHILYPMGGKLPQNMPPFAPFSLNGKPFVVVFAGSLADWYGPMLEKLVMHARAQTAPVEFRFYGSNPSWSPQFDAFVRKENIFRGHLAFDELRRQVSEADALILPMGFDEGCAQVESTSFKTKFLDYLSYQKPILVWGPEYCSAVRVAREFDSAEICSTSDALTVLDKILHLRNNSERQVVLVDHARRMYEDRFHPDKIHEGLVEKIRETVQVFR